MMIPMELQEIQIVDDAMQSQVVVLGEQNGSRTFQIYIGLVEAAAMDAAVKGVVHPRPMTHDLIMNVIKELGATLVEVQVDDLRDSGDGHGTFFGKLVLETANGERVLVDSRPSDALVLAMKADVPVFVADHVLSEVCGESPSEPDDSEDVDTDPGEL